MSQSTLPGGSPHAVLGRWYRTQGAAFKYRDFRFLWTAALSSSFGMWMEQVALGWLILEMTNSAFMLGVASAVRMAPFLFVGVPAGAVADRVDRRAFLRFLNTGIAVVSLLIAALITRAQITTLEVILLALLIGVFRAASMPINQAITYDIVGRKDALNGMAMVSMAMRMGGVVGSLFAGGIIAGIGVKGVYLGMAASYFASVAMLLLVREPGQSAPLCHATLWQNLKGGVRILRDNRVLTILMAITAAMEGFGFSHMQLLPIFARDIFHVGAGGLGLMVATRAGGGVLGVALLGGLGNFKAKGKLLLATVGACGLSLAAFALIPSFWPALVILAGTNAAAAMSSVLYQTLMQQVVTNEERGRAMGAWVLGVGVAPVGHLELGALARALGAPAALVVNGVLLLGLALGFSTIRNVRKL